MEYYELLNLKKEPFSNSPDPNYLFQSRQHRLCLQRLELSVRLKRGLNVVVGEVGTGKTTLCRQLLVRFGKDDSFESYLILEPQVCGPTDFLLAIASHFDGEGARRADSDAALKEIIKNHLFRSGVEKGKTIVLIIDEGQKMPPFCLEIVRELLNYETNEHKLLQIIIFAQPEFDAILANHANVTDRISMRHDLEPMGFRDTQLMIAYRLHQAGLTERAASPFSFAAVVAIYLASGGYPRKIVNLCHQCVLALLIQNRKRAGWRLVRSCVMRMHMDPGNRLGKAGWSLGTAVIVLVLAGLVWMPRSLTAPVAPPDKAVAVVRSAPDSTVPLTAAPPPATTPSEGTEAPARAASPSSVLPAASPPLSATALTPHAAEAGTPAVPLTASSTPVDDRGAPAGGVSEPPETIGAAMLKRNEMLSWMMIKIYGSYDNDLLGRLLETNPEIGDPNNIEVGTPIFFPAIPRRIKNTYAGNWWVSVAETDRLDEALAMVRRYPPRLKPVRIIPYWEKARGLRFELVLWRYYGSETDARNAASDLPMMAGRAAAVINGWPQDAVLYADPFSGTKSGK